MKTARTTKAPILLAAFILQHSAFGIAAAAEGAAAEPPPAAAQEGVQLWEGGPLWADRNVGADEPWERGLHFWWGDTVGYRRENDAWAASDDASRRRGFAWFPECTPTYGKSADTLQGEGWTTADDVLAPEHDAARVNWGGEWRMPTSSELEALRDKCDWSWTTTNGASGFVVRGRGDFAGAGIFLPAAGRGTENKWWGQETSGSLWASEPYADGRPADCTWRLRFGSREIGTNFCWDRYIATPVRPVRDE